MTWVQFVLGSVLLKSEFTADINPPIPKGWTRDMYLQRVWTELGYSHGVYKCVCKDLHRVEQSQG